MTLPSLFVHSNKTLACLALLGTLVVVGLIVASTIGAQENASLQNEGMQLRQAGNRTPSANATATDRPALQHRDDRYRLCASDVVTLTFPLTPEFDQTINIQPDGYASLAGVGDVRLEGLTTAESLDAIRRAYAKVLNNPIVTMEMRDFNKPYFMVNGQVHSAGRFDLRGYTTATQAITMAGGFEDSAKHSQVLLFRRVNNDWYEVKNLNLKHILQGHDVNEDPEIRSGDMLFANLETTLGSEHLTSRPLCGLGDIVSAPSDCLDYLDVIRARVVGLANNHSYDFGAEGLTQTRAAISAHGRGFTAIGAGRDLRSDPEVVIWQGSGAIRVGFWAAARATLDPATRDSAGVEPATAARALRALELMKADGATFCVALVHAGCLRTSYPDPEDVELMDRIAGLGFDVVAASHSHRISGAKLIGGAQDAKAFCFYGLGSLVSGFAAHLEEREGLVVVASLDSNGILAQLEVRPVLLAESGFGEIPAPIANCAILDRFRRISREIEDGSFEPAFYREVCNGVFRLYVRDARRAFEQLGVRGLARKMSRLRMRHVKRLVHRVTG